MALAAGGLVKGPVYFVPDNSYILPKSALNAYDISNYITDISFEPMIDAFEELAGVTMLANQRVATFNLVFNLENFRNLYWYMYGVEYPPVSKMHADYRRKTRRRNRRR